MAGDEFDKTDDDNLGEMADDIVPADARPVCPNCFEPCSPLQDYCDSCNSNQPINPLATYKPFERIRFNYDIFATMWRGIWNGSNISWPVRILYIFLLLLFTPLFLFAPPLLLIERIKDTKTKKLATIVFFAFLTAAALAYILFT
jgi:hypothetical protein